MILRSIFPTFSCGNRLFLASKKRRKHEALTRRANSRAKTNMAVANARQYGQHIAHVHWQTRNLFLDEVHATSHRFELGAMRNAWEMRKMNVEYIDERRELIIISV
jgi:hypothetical protein